MLISEYRQVCAKSLVWCEVSRVYFTLSMYYTVGTGGAASRRREDEAGRRVRDEGGGERGFHNNLLKLCVGMNGRFDVDSHSLCR